MNDLDHFYILGMALHMLQPYRRRFPLLDMFGIQALARLLGYFLPLHLQVVVGEVVITPNILKIKRKNNK